MIVLLQKVQGGLSRQRRTEESKKSQNKFKEWWVICSESTGAGHSGSAALFSTHTHKARQTSIFGVLLFPYIFQYTLVSHIITHTKGFDSLHFHTCCLPVVDCIVATVTAHSEYIRVHATEQCCSHRRAQMSYRLTRIHSTKNIQVPSWWQSGWPFCRVTLLGTVKMPVKLFLNDTYVVYGHDADLPLKHLHNFQSNGLLPKRTKSGFF